MGYMTPRFLKVSQIHSVVKKYIKFLLTKMNKHCTVLKQDNIKELSLGKTDSLLENKFSCHSNGPFSFSSEFHDES